MFFTRLGALVSGDPFEGAFPQLNFDNVREAAKLESVRAIDSAAMKGIEEYLGNPEAISSMLAIARRIIYVQCWHANSFESDAMWKLYMNGNEGIAIRSTVGRIKESLGPAPQEQWIARMHYYDPESRVKLFRCIPVTTSISSRSRPRSCVGPPTLSGAKRIRRMESCDLAFSSSRGAAPTSSKVTMRLRSSGAVERCEDQGPRSPIEPLAEPSPLDVALPVAVFSYPLRGVGPRGSSTRPKIKCSSDSIF
jgi:hypothetical protein